MENLDDGCTGGQQSNPFRKTGGDINNHGSESMTKLPEIVSNRSSITLNNKSQPKNNENFEFGSATRNKLKNSI